MIDEDDFRTLLISILDVGLRHDTHLEYGSTVCDDDCEACEVEDSIYRMLDKLRNED